MENVQEYPELKKWAVEYFNAAEDAGEGEDTFFNDNSDLTYSPVAGTIKLVCDVFPYVDWQEWLPWQYYGGPRGRGPWWIIEFYDFLPYRWSYGTLILHNPWDFAFSSFLIASEGDIGFNMYNSRKERLNKTKCKWLANAVLDGVLHDYDESEFRLWCQKAPHSRTLDIRISYPQIMDDFFSCNPSTKPKKDAHGIYWC